MTNGAKLQKQENVQLKDQLMKANETITSLEQQLDEYRRDYVKRTNIDKVANDVYLNLTQIFTDNFE